MAIEMEYQLSNGRWRSLNPADIPARLERALKQDQVVAHNLGRPAAASTDEIVRRLEQGDRVSTGPDWYDQMRRKPAPRPPVQVEKVRADCGHWVAKGSVMMASLGTSCPECYDDMSG